VSECQCGITSARLQREHAYVVTQQRSNNVFTLMFVMGCSKWIRCVVKSAMSPSTAALIVSGNMHSFTRELANALSSSPSLLQKLQESQVDNVHFYSHAAQTLLCKIWCCEVFFPPVGLLNASLHFAKRVLHALFLVYTCFTQPL